MAWVHVQVGTQSGFLEEDVVGEWVENKEWFGFGSFLEVVIGAVAVFLAEVAGGPCFGALVEVLVAFLVETLVAYLIDAVIETLAAFLVEALSAFLVEAVVEALAAFLAEVVVEALTASLGEVVVGA